ncbi:hypothetical protein [Winogradskyella pulchriflava]|uniref:Uncharacterized protein n=1 Tax=Winogradskyella pulchriflava TaxID=1110688 RepID=A0ABV6QDB7_9FLAO
MLTYLGMGSKLNGIEMRKFETKEELVEWIETMHLQNTNGRETGLEMFKLGIEATIEELTEFNLFSIPVVSKSVALCGSCKQELTLVRPGKHQCDNENCPSNVC